MRVVPSRTRSGNCRCGSLIRACSIRVSPTSSTPERRAMPERSRLRCSCSASCRRQHRGYIWMPTPGTMPTSQAGRRAEKRRVCARYSPPSNSVTRASRKDTRGPCGAAGFAPRSVARAELFERRRLPLIDDGSGLLALPTIEIIVAIRPSHGAPPSGCRHLPPQAEEGFRLIARVPSLRHGGGIQTDALTDAPRLSFPCEAGEGAEGGWGQSRL